MPDKRIISVVKSVDISEYERRGIDSSANVTFLDGSSLRFEEFNLSPKLIEGLEIEFALENPVQTLRCVNPYTYIARSLGISKAMERSIEEYLSELTLACKEAFFKEYFLKVKDGNKALPKIKGITTRTRMKFQSFISNLFSLKLFIPFSIKYELFKLIFNNVKDENTKIAQVFGADADFISWLEYANNRLATSQSANGAIDHAVFSGFIQNAFDRDTKYAKYILFLLNHVENRVYRRIKEGKFTDEHNISYDSYDKSDMYAPFFIETDENFDFTKEVDLSAYFKSLRANRTSRYSYFDYDKAQLLKSSHILFPYFSGNLMLELMICGMSMDQVTYLLKNISSFEANSPYLFTKRTETNVDFTLKEIELIIKKTGFNKSYVLEDAINSFLKDQIRLTSKEDVFIDAVDIKKGKSSTITGKDGKKYYSYEFSVNQKYSNMLLSIYKNIDIDGFLRISKTGLKTIQFEDFCSLFEIYVLNNPEIFITQPYSLEKDDELLLYGKIKDKKPYDELPYFTKIGLATDDQVETSVYKKLIEGARAKHGAKDDGKCEEWIKSEEIINGFSFTDEQKEALRGIYTIPRLFILSGYAGTGKSTITKSIVRRFSDLNLDNAIGCALAGVAANRLNNLTGIFCETIHSVLKYAGGNTFLAPSKLDYDLVVVDEASMIDAALFKELLSRIDFSTTSLLIIGDDAQLPPIGKGEPFSDIINAIKDGYFNAPHAVLTKIQRSAGTIVSMANDIRSGKINKISDTVYGKESTTYVKVEDKVDYINEAKFYNKIRVDVKYDNSYGNLSYELYKNDSFGRIGLQDVSSEKILADKMFALIKKHTNLDPLEFKNFQIISPSKSGNDFATKNLNDTIQQMIFKGKDVPFLKVGKSSGYYVGDKVIHVKNTDMKFVATVDKPDSFCETRIYNGQLGRVIKINALEETLEVLYEDGGQIVKYDAIQAHALLKPAYVLTAHKVQGNEFKTVVNIIPFVKTQIGRKYLYSSFTRAKDRLYVIGKREYFDKGLEEETKRRNTKIYKLFKDDAKLA